MQTTSRDARPVVLAQAGAGIAAIVPPQHASATDLFAAEELQRHLGRMSGCESARASSCCGSIFINDVDRARSAGIDWDAGAHRPESSCVATHDGDVHILGADARGTLYGAYELLHRLGVRWFTPGVDLVPQPAQAVLGALRHETAPAFEYRDLFGSEPDDGLWRVRNRFNGHHGAADDGLGGSLHYGLWVHTFYELVPPGEFFANHPEYFSYRDGARRAEGGQLCLTNPDLIAIVAERVMQRMRECPKSRLFSVSQNDWYGRCECPACQRAEAETGAASGPLLRFVNAIAEKTNRVFPDRIVDTLAYQYTLEAPRGVPIHPNVRIRICPIVCCQAHPFGTCNHRESQRFREAFNGWSKITNQLYVWHYFPNFPYRMLPMPNFDELTGNARFYQEHGVKGLFWQGEPDGESQALRRYLMARLAWNPRIDPWATVDEWLVGVYGPATAQALRPFYDAFHALVRDNRNLCITCDSKASIPLFGDGVLDTVDTILAAAEATCTRDVARRDVRLMRAGIDYASVWRKADTFRLDGDSYRGDATEADVALADTLVDRLCAGGIRTINGASKEEDIARLRTRLFPYAIERLDGERQHLVAVPGLGGRIIRWESNGRQWFIAPDPLNQYDPAPYNGGYAESVSVHGAAGSLSANAFSAWTAARENGALVLRAAWGDQVLAERIVSLNEGALVLETRVANRTAETVSCHWSSSCWLEAPDFAGAAVRTTQRVVTIPEPELPDELIFGRVVSTEGCHGGMWEIAVPGKRLQCELAAVGLKQVIIGRVMRTGLLGIDIRTDPVSMGAGEEVRFMQRLRVIQESE